MRLINRGSGIVICLQKRKLSTSYSGDWFECWIDCSIQIATRYLSTKNVYATKTWRTSPHLWIWKITEHFSLFSDILDTKQQLNNRKKKTYRSTIRVDFLMLGKRQEHPHQVIHVGFACRMDVFQELQKVEGVTIHQMDSYGQIWLVLQNHSRKEIQK